MLPYNNLSFPKTKIGNPPVLCFHYENRGAPLEEDHLKIQETEGADFRKRDLTTIDQLHPTQGEFNPIPGGTTPLVHAIREIYRRPPWI
jgi:hypothetical protein